MYVDIVSLEADPLAAAGRAVLGLAEALAAEGHEVVLRARGAARATVRRGPRVTVEYLAARGRTAAEAARHAGVFGAELARHWAAAPPDLVSATGWLSGLAVRAAGPGGVPVVQCLRGLEASAGADRTDRAERAAPERTGLRLTTALGMAADAVVVGSSADAERLGRLGVPRDRTYLIPRGVDLEAFRPAGDVRPAGAPRLIHVCRDPHDADLATAVRALPAIPGAELVLLGGTVDERLGRLVSRLGVAGRVRCTAPAGRTDAAGLLRSGDIAVSLSGNSGFDDAVVEAMACGLPVIATAAGGGADSLLHGRTGYCVPAGQPSALAGYARLLLSDEVRREAFGFAAVDRARSRYAWARIVAEALTVYDRVLAGAGRPA